MVAAPLPGKVVALPGSGRPDDALARLREVLTDDEEAIRGVILVTVSADGSIDPRVYGEVRRYEFSHVGNVLSDHAVNGDFEAA